MIIVYSIRIKFNGAYVINCNTMRATEEIRFVYNSLMNKTEKKMLEILKESQFGNGDVSFDDVELVSLLKEARHQSVLGLVLPFIPKKDLPGEYAHYSEIQMANHIRYLHEEDQLKKNLDTEKIPFVILKGNAAAIYYKNPGQRSMGDVDFLVSEDNYARTQEVMLSAGYQLQHDEGANHRHTSFSKNKQLFELHRRFSHDDVDIEDIVSTGMKSREIHTIDGYEFPMLPKLANGFVLLDHMRNHLKSGLGLRQVIDWMMYVNAELDDEFWNTEFGSVANEKGMDTLAMATTKMCQKYLGLKDSITWCASANESICDELMDCLLESGNFGRKQGSGSNIVTVSSAIKQEGLFRRLQRMGEYNWEAYKKHHWLKPFCWIYQGCRYIKQGLKTKRNSSQLREDAKRGKERYELLKKLNIH